MADISKSSETKSFQGFATDSLQGDNNTLQHCDKKKLNDRISATASLKTATIKSRHDFSLIQVNQSMHFSREHFHPNCEHYIDYEDLAYAIVDDVIEKAINHLKNIQDCEIERDSIVSLQPNIRWPKNGEFSKDFGETKIREYIDITSRVHEEWKYVLTSVGDFSNSVSDFYLYEAKFSIPTRCYPVPQVAVSIFFQYEVSRVVPSECPVRISYFLEGSRAILLPGKCIITDMLLLRIAESKLAIFKKLKW